MDDCFVMLWNGVSFRGPPLTESFVSFCCWSWLLCLARSSRSCQSSPHCDHVDRIGPAVAPVVSLKACCLRPEVPVSRRRFGGRSPLKRLVLCMLLWDAGWHLGGSWWTLLAVRHDSKRLAVRRFLLRRGLQHGDSEPRVPTLA